MKKKTKAKKITIICTAVAALVAAVILVVSVIADRATDPVEGEPVSSPRQTESGDRKTFLLLGKDRASGLTDVIMLVSIDTDSKSAAVLQIPRDTYARYTDKSYKKLNGAVSALGGADKLCRLISDAANIKIDGYVVFDLDVVVKLVDSVGGVEIELPFDMEYSDPYQGLNIKFKAGKQTLDGEAAEKFIRYRSGYVRGDLGRIDAQKMFMAAFIEKAYESMTPSTLLKLITSVFGDIKTDMSLFEMTEIALTVFDIELENINMLTLPGEDIRAGESGAWYYVISKSAAEKVFSKYFGAQAGEFDRGGIFVDPSSDDFVRIYDSDIEIYPLTVSDVIQNGIEIQKR
ncbi:MAG: LytR family transcriptional regulator [Ruminococcaceae bacterium]|nr:LytR family transcriptional regulator [Oscillospiraceae bacterium]